jgi:hypothetical protein
MLIRLLHRATKINIFCASNAFRFTLLPVHTVVTDRSVVAADISDTDLLYTAWLRVVSLLILIN